MDLRNYRLLQSKHLGCLSCALIFLACMLGCSVGPNFVPPVTDVPATWNAQEVVTPEQPSKTVVAPVALVDWWRSFKDPTLNSLVNLAMSANPDVRQAEARIRQARASRGIAVAGFFPAINSQSFFQRSHGSSATVGAGGTPAFTSSAAFSDLFQVGFDASWELDVFGGTRRNLEATSADLQAAFEDRRDVLVTLAGDVGTNYLSLRGYQQQLAIARQNLEAQKKTAEITHKRFQAGFVSRLDVANADAQVETTAAQIPLLESSIRATNYSLEVLLGQNPGFMQNILARPYPVPPVPLNIPVGFPSDLLRRRPDIRRAESQLHAATARIGVAVADLFPRFFLTGNAGVSASDLTRITNIQNSKYWSFSPSVTWPVFAAGKIRWNIELQDAKAQEALFFYQKTVLTSLQEVETDLVAYAKEQAHWNHLDQAVRSNRQAVDLSMKLYLAGKTDFLNVLTAQRALFVNEDALAQSRRTLVTNLVALYKALGGGWENHPYSQASLRPEKISTGS
jgi:outer membrane protein, multidrug efflux system